MAVKLRKSIQSMYQKNAAKKNMVGLLLIGEEGKSHYVFMKHFITSIYDQTLHHGRKYFCCSCLQDFSTEKILKRILKIDLKLMVSKGLRCL